MVLMQEKTRPVEVRGRNLLIRLAESEAEVEASQRLRYSVFVEEMAAQRTAARTASGREFDAYDDHCEHLLVFDLDRCAGDDGDPGGVVGTYRFMRRAQAATAGGFYTAGEYDIAKLEAVDGEILEVGRSCIDSSYRDGATIQLLWKGISAYVFHYDVTFLFGCASLPSVKPDELAVPLSFLYHNHLAPDQLRVRALPELFVDMNRLAAEEIDKKEALKALPPLQAPSEQLRRAATQQARASATQSAGAAAQTSARSPRRTARPARSPPFHSPLASLPPP